MKVPNQIFIRGNPKTIQTFKAESTRRGLTLGQLFDDWARTCCTEGQIPEAKTTHIEVENWIVEAFGGAQEVEMEVKNNLRKRVGANMAKAVRVTTK
ncbi:MAG: hypothetical protein KKI08_24215 [Armatimonadetes bacterium]|nr:hypothetical protein [Armatimonadota bacterium]